MAMNNFYLYWFDFNINKSDLITYHSSLINLICYTLSVSSIQIDFVITETDADSLSKIFKLLIKCHKLLCTILEKKVTTFKLF